MNTYTRKGTELLIPLKTYQHFPDVYLDGELWFGRGHFLDSKKVVGAPLTSVDVSFLRYSFLAMQKIIPSRAVAFDDPSPTQSLIFETRYLQVLKALHSELALLVSSYDFDNDSILT